jgi:hypothetical protein
MCSLKFGKLKYSIVAGWLLMSVIHFGLLTATPGKADGVVLSSLTPNLEIAITDFLGVHRKGHECYFRNPPLHIQVLQQMRLPDEPFAKRLSGGFTLYVGGKPHDFGDSAAVLVNSFGKIEAIAVDGCDWSTAGAQRSRNPGVYVYAREDVSRAKYLNALRAWRGFTQGKLHVYSVRAE